MCSHRIRGHHAISMITVMAPILRRDHGEKMEHNVIAGMIGDYKVIATETLLLLLTWLNRWKIQQEL